MALIVVFHNDSTEEGETGNYNVMTYVNERKIWSGRVEGHDRRDGWKELFLMLADQFDEK